MKHPDPLPLAAYAQTIELIYPKHLRERYQDQMLQTAGRRCSLWAPCSSATPRMSGLSRCQLKANARPFACLASGAVS